MLSVNDRVGGGTGGKGTGNRVAVSRKAGNTTAPRRHSHEKTSDGIAHGLSRRKGVTRGEEFLVALICTNAPPFLRSHTHRRPSKECGGSLHRVEKWEPALTASSWIERSQGADTPTISVQGQGMADPYRVQSAGLRLDTTLGQSGIVHLKNLLAVQDSPSMPSGHGRIPLNSNHTSWPHPEGENGAGRVLLSRAKEGRWEVRLVRGVGKVLGLQAEAEVLVEGHTPAAHHAAIK